NLPATTTGGRSGENDNLRVIRLLDQASAKAADSVERLNLALRQLRALRISRLGVDRVGTEAEKARKEVSRLGSAFRAMGRVAASGIRHALGALGQLRRALFSIVTAGPLAPLLAAAGVGFGVIQII